MKRGGKRLVWVAYAAAIFVGLHASNMKGISQSAVEKPPNQKDFELPFVLKDGYLIVVEGGIEGGRRVKLALDTGATHSVLRADLARGHALTGRPARVVNLDHLVTQEEVDVANFQLGPIRISHLPMMTSDLGYLGQTGSDLDGVIGLDVLRLRSFSLDLGKRRITFGPPRVLHSSAAMEMGQSYLGVEVRMADRPVRLVVDTGVPSILLYRDRMGDRLPNLKIEQTTRGSSLSGSVSLEVVTLPRLQLNGAELRRQAVLLQNSPTGFLPEVDGYLALAALGAWRFNFDFERKLLSWE